MRAVLLAVFVMAAGVSPLEAAVAIDCEQSAQASNVDPEDWLAACRAAAEQGAAAAQTNIGRLYQAGRGVARDFGIAADWYRKAAEQGDAVAQDLLGRLYAAGDGVAQDPVKAEAWYRKAAAKGLADAELDLGQLYQLNYRRPRDAIAWFEKAAAKGQRDAPYALAQLYQMGRDIEADPQAAAKWYGVAADFGDARAQYQLGLLYEAGTGVPQDTSLAYKWLNLAGTRGDSAASDARGRVLGTMTTVQVLDAQRSAREWSAAHRPVPVITTAAASPGPALATEPPSMADARICNDIRPSRAAIPPEAAACERLASQGFGPAQYKLGLLNAMQIGAEHAQTAEKWFRRSLPWYRQVADVGIPEAALVLASIYESGFGVPRDPEQALAWYAKAFELGSADAAFLLGYMYWMGDPNAPQDYVLARDWFRKAAEMGVVGAQTQLGNIYSRDRAGPADYVQAYLWLSLAAAGGDKGAMDRRNRIEPKMSPDQIEQARALLASWKPKIAN
jgi:TPR repeat protein